MRESLVRGFFPLVLVAAIGSTAASSRAQSTEQPSMKIGEIEFFGVGDRGQSGKRQEQDARSEGQRAKSGRQKAGGKRYDREELEWLRQALPVKEGDALNRESAETTIAEIKRTVKQTTGRESTQVNFLCCNDRRDWIIFIGLPGPAYRPFQYHPKPRGTVRLPAKIVRLVARVGELASEAAQNDPREDRSQGYALSMYPPMREVQMRIRAYAISNADRLRHVLMTAADAKQRRAAAYALGYATQNEALVMALANAARDSSSEVRNDATRALGVIAVAKPKLAARVPPANFVAMLSSGSWTDRNKSAFVLAMLTARRDSALLRTLRRTSLEALIEMARWRNTGHAHNARVILGRVAGIEETRLQKLASEGKVEEIVGAVRR